MLPKRRIISKSTFQSKTVRYPTSPFEREGCCIKRNSRVGLWFALPFLCGFFLFYIIPFAVSITYTFQTGRNEFAGLSNYRSVFASSAFQLAAINTGRFILVGVPLVVAVSLMLSLLLFRNFSGSALFRTIFLSPMVMPVASVAMLVQVFFSDKGVTNSILSLLGIPVQSWIQSDWAFVLLILLYIWKNAGYNLVLFLAGLKSISHEYFEIAMLEGATGWDTFRYVTLPMLRPSLFFVLVISVVNTFKSFREAYLLGGDIPHKSIYVLQHFINNNFSGLNYVRVSVAAFIVFVVLAALVFCLYKGNRRVSEEL